MRRVQQFYPGAVTAGAEAGLLPAGGAQHLCERVCRTDFDPVQPIVPTNRDRLDAMSDAQLAQWLERLTGNPTENLLRWLRAPAETNEEETPWKIKPSFWRR